MIQSTVDAVWYKTADIRRDKHAGIRPDPSLPQLRSLTAESFERQSSQHPGWQGSEAQAYIAALIRAAYRATDAYADGEVVR